METGVNSVQDKIKSFKRKYYLNLLIRGSMICAAIILSYYLLIAFLEYALWLGPVFRFALLATFFSLVVYSAFNFLLDPFHWFVRRRGLSEEQSAKIIGEHMPAVKDRLLNLIQLSAADATPLAKASILQKSTEFEPLAFDTFIDIRANSKYLKFLILPIVVLGLVLIVNRQILTESTSRIVHFNRLYSPQAPFQFSIQSPLEGFYNEDFQLTLEMKGDAIPADAYVLWGKQRSKLIAQDNGLFTFTFEKVQGEMDFQIEAAGFYSDPYHLSVVNRPEILEFSIGLEYPRYIQRKNDKLVNAGNLEVPEGTKVHWNISTANSSKATFVLKSLNQPSLLQSSDSKVFTFEKAFKNPDQYEIILENEKARNKDRISYQIDVVKDQYPRISVNNFKDSVLYNRIVLGGSVSDDYGISQLSLHFRIRNENQQEVFSRNVNIPVSRNQAQQSFIHNWSLDSLKLNPGDQLEYYLQVWDNDGVNGRKSTKTSFYTFNVPSKDKLVAEITRAQSQAENKIEQSSTNANKLQDQISQANQRLKGKESLDWQDKKMLEDIIQQKDALDKMLEQLKEENKMLEQKKDAFSEQDERIREKAEQIRKLMDELLDDETKKLFEELQKLLKENSDVSQMQKLLDKLNQNTSNLEKELERTLELFKQLQYDYKLDQTIQDLKQQVQDQKSVLEKTEQLEKDMKADKKPSEKSQSEQQEKSSELGKEQEKLNEEFEQTSKQLEELEKLGKELDKNDDLPSQEDAEEVKDQQQQSEEMLQQNQPSKSKAPQQKSIQKMQQMQQQMESMQNSMSMEMDMENMESLRQIIHGLVKLSYDQESLMKNFNELSQSDPRFNGLAQQQLKLKDDAKVLEDSLLALGKRDPFMGSIVTKEVSELNDHLDKVIEANRERRRPQAAGEMQMSMTSINNLALMLDDHFDMMMQMMANAQPSMKKSKQKGNKPSLSQMQQQLNQKIEELKGSGKGGRQLSEELAEMAAEQERIRKALEEMQQKMGEDGKMPGGDIQGKMEQSEMDLVNKQLTDQLIKRQQEILTRLLQAEKSMREQDMDDERKGEAAKDYENEIPKAFEEYLRLKEKEVELLKTVPPKLFPYYKKEVRDYFNRMSNQP